MIKLIINKIDGYNYYLEDNNNKLYKFNIEFYDLINKPNVGDYIYVDELFLKEQNTLLNFGPIDGKYGKQIELNDDRDLMILVINNQKMYLKRYYG